ncbi:MAG: sulfatase-like hydrolase/transferase [Lachnospiraceae bacterium]|nr:sulfatase-like hydrolase/transferase [Lachnospiraceae bacterium]
MVWKIVYRKSERILFITMLIKYLVSIGFAFLAIITMKNIKYTVIALLELFLVMILTDLLTRKKRVPGCILNAILIFLFDVQMAILFFSSTYIETIMLSNLDSIEDIQGNSTQYLITIVVIFVTSLLPVRAIGNRFYSFRKSVTSFLITSVAEVLFLTGVGIGYSPFSSYIILLQQEYNIYQLHQIVDAGDESVTDDSSDDDTEQMNLFYSDGISNYRQKDSLLPENPNVILIFTEGLSQNLIDDEREIMPNIASFQRESVTFTGYYNHTYATYRGLIGQLFSGYQMDNFDENHFISLQSIFKDKGYRTAIINTEPNNEEFTAYLNSLGFDEVIGEPTNDLLGLADSYSDRQAYDLLYNTAQSLSESEEPFFVVIYTFGTHATLTSTDEVFEAGNNDELNKFYNLDVQFGTFFEYYHESSLAEDTVLVFTTDHATYQDSEFVSAFPDYVRLSMQADKIPLSIYYEGTEPETIEVNGRNSLDLAPTILDYLDISAPNYFLGDSLFAETSASCWDTVFFSDTSPLSSEDNVLSNLKGEDLQLFEDMVQKYFIYKLSDSSGTSSETVSKFKTGIDWNLSEDGQELEIIYTPSSNEEYGQYWYAVWSRETEGEADGEKVIWYLMEKLENGSWRSIVSLSDVTTHGEIRVNVYGGTDEAADLLEYASIIVP